MITRRELWLAGAGGAEPAAVQVLTPDDESLAAMGLNPLDPAVRAPVARAGHRQGQRAAAGVARWWAPTGR